MRRSDEQAVLELVEATVVKDGVRALDRVTLAVRAGEHTAIVGPNGSGKTSLVNLLTLDDWPLAREEGTPPVRLFGRPLWDRFDLRAKLGVVSADLHQRFVAGNSAGPIRGEEAVVSAFFAAHGFVFRTDVTSEMRRKAHDALARVDAAALAGRFLHEMSTGEARRVLIARALVTDPAVLVLDEPAAGLDLVARRRFLDDIRQVAAGGTTLVLVTHHVEEIVPEIDRVVLLRRGRVVASGPKRATLTAANLSAAFDAPLQVFERDGYYAVDLER
jgi:iron complex transport system ATP-binding protein